MKTSGQKMLSGLKKYWLIYDLILFLNKLHIYYPYFYKVFQKRVDLVYFHARSECYFLDGTFTIYVWKDPFCKVALEVKFVLDTFWRYQQGRDAGSYVRGLHVTTAFPEHI